VHPEYQRWVRRWTREFLVVGPLVALILAVSLLFLFPCEISCRSNPFSWIGFYELLAYPGAMGLLIFQYHQGMGRFKRDWREGRGIVQAIGSASENEQVLRLTGELCSQLGTTKLVPKKVFWKDAVQVPVGEMPANLEMPSDLVSIGSGNMVLPKRMQGVLTVEEWRPIIASSLIFMPWVRRKMVRTLELSALGVLGYAVATFLLLQYFGYGVFSFQGSLAFHPAILLTLGVALFVITGRYFAPEGRQELLKADKKAAELYGRDEFVRALQKIDNMGFSDVQKLEKKKRSLYNKPSVAERLENLSLSH
jgi:hypothetical protein